MTTQIQIQHFVNVNPNADNATKATNDSFKYNTLLMLIAISYKTTYKCS